jgi:hypothetical protein
MDNDNTQSAIALLADRLKSTLRTPHLFDLIQKRQVLRERQPVDVFSDYIKRTQGRPNGFCGVDHTMNPEFPYEIGHGE